MLEHRGRCLMVTFWMDVQLFYFSVMQRPTCSQDNIPVILKNYRSAIMACFYSDPFSHSFRRIDYKLKRKDSTKSLLIKTEQLLRIEDHDFAMRPGFGGQDALFICSNYQSPSQSGKSQLEWSF